MTSLLHPIMEMALQPFAPRSIAHHPQGVYHPGMSQFQHNVGGIVLDCWLEYSPPQTSTSVDPAYPAQADLCHVYHRGEDIYDFTPDWLIDEIENAYLEEMGVA